MEVTRSCNGSHSILTSQCCHVRVQHMQPSSNISVTTPMAPAVSTGATLPIAFMPMMGMTMGAIGLNSRSSHDPCLREGLLDMS